MIFYWAGHRRLPVMMTPSIVNGIIWRSFGKAPVGPVTGKDDPNKIRVGIVRGGYVSDGNVSGGGQF